MNITDKNSTKDKIIQLLSYEWPLPLRNIYYNLKKQGLKITYQAVHKAIHQMLEDKKIIQTKEGYSINLEWIKSVHDQTEIIRVNYFSKQRSFQFDKNESIKVFIFNTWFDVEKYIYYLQKSILLKSKDKKSVCIHHNHEWRPLFYSRAEYNWIKKLKNLNYHIYTVCAGNTVIDKWSKNFYNEIGNNIILGKKMNSSIETVVFSDFVVQIYIPFEIQNSFDKKLKQIKKIDDFNHAYFIENIFEKKDDFKVVITQDPHLADEIRKQIVSKFN